jgi:hypothetical protein
MILIGFMNLLIYFVSYSRTSTIIGFLALLLYLWFKSNYFNKLKQFFCLGILPFGFAISILPALLYEKIPGLHTIDGLFQWRITFSRHYLEAYPLRLLGNNLSADPVILDSGYVELIVNYGLLFTAIYASFFMVIIVRCLKRKMYRELLVITCISIYGITESFIPNLFTNVSLIFWGELIFYTGLKKRGCSIEQQGY